MTDKLILKSRDLTVAINSQGRVASIQPATSDEVLDDSVLSPLIRVKNPSSEAFEAPTEMTWKRKRSAIFLYLTFPRNKAVIRAEEKSTHMVLELTKLTGEDVEVITWGPIHVTIEDIVAEYLCAAYDDQTAVGMMSLNLKTSGGGYRGPDNSFSYLAAVREPGRTSLQTYARDRTRPDFLMKRDEAKLWKPRIIPLEGETPVGSRIALYSTDSDNLLNRVSEIVQAEDLFYPTKNGDWLKELPFASSSMLLIAFDPSNIDQVLDVAERAGINQVYHPAMFKSWGTFEPNTPMEEVKKMVAKAAQRGIRLGAHTLSNFITPTDPLVSPVPHPGLQLDTITRLKSPLDETATEIVLADDTEISGFDVIGRGVLSAVRIGDELIEYSARSEQAPWTLTGCKRGSWGTRISSHNAGVEVGKVACHSYSTFFPDIKLQDTMARNLAGFFNESGMMCMGFDGLEGCRRTGHGFYASDRFVKVFYDALNDKSVTSGSSILTHFTWHYMTAESWGEPWYGGFRGSQMDHRLRSQKLLVRNKLPAKLGQFKIDNHTTVEDVNWVMGLCAGLDAGLDYYMSPNFLEEHPDAESILATVKAWETSRLNSLFTEEQKVELRNTKTIYGLEPKGDSYELVFVRDWFKEQQEKEERKLTLMGDVFGEQAKYSVLTDDLPYVNKPREPGQPTAAFWTVKVEGRPQPLQAVIRSAGENTQVVRDAYFKIGALRCDVPFEIQPGQYVLVPGDGTMQLFDSEGKALGTKPVEDLHLVSGDNQVEFSTFRDGVTPGPQVTVNFKTFIRSYSLTTGKPTTASAAIELAPLANDGLVDDVGSTWRTSVSEGKPAWWQVDLENPERISELVLLPYWGPRYFQFTIETSLDGETWTTAVDASENTEPVPGQTGYRFEIPPTEARYIRVNMLKHSLNNGVFIVEFMAFST